MRMNREMNEGKAAHHDDADLTVVGGAGHVGIPLVLCFADSGLRVLINDLNEVALRSLREGVLPFIEHDAQPVLDRVLKNGALRYGTRPSDIGRNGPVIVTIGTPVDEFLNPVLGQVKRCLDGILPHMADGQLMILRSTVYPGTTEWIARYLEGLGLTPPGTHCPAMGLQGS